MPTIFMLWLQLRDQEKERNEKREKEIHLPVFIQISLLFISLLHRDMTLSGKHGTQIKSHTVHESNLRKMRKKDKDSEGGAITNVLFLIPSGNMTCKRVASCIGGVVYTDNCTLFSRHQFNWQETKRNQGVKDQDKERYIKQVPHWFQSFLFPSFLVSLQRQRHILRTSKGKIEEKKSWKELSCFVYKTFVSFPSPSILISLFNHVLYGDQISFCWTFCHVLFR